MLFNPIHLIGILELILNLIYQMLLTVSIISLFVFRIVIYGIFYIFRALFISLSTLFHWPKFGHFRNSRWEVSCQKGAFNNFAKSKENTCARVSFIIKLQAFKKRLQRRCFPVKNFFYRIPRVGSSVILLCKIQNDFHFCPYSNIFWLFILSESVFTTKF